MPKEPLPMHRIEAVLQCRGRNLSVRKIAASLGLKRSTVSDYLRRAERAGLSWPLPAHVTEESLHQALFGSADCKACSHPLPDWPTIHQELRQKGVTLQLLHDEYLYAYPDGYRYSQFCELYRRFRGSLRVCMRQTYQPGEKLFVDYAGPTFKIIDGATDKPAEAYLFVAVLGASNFTYAEAVGTLGLEDWTGAHCNAFEFFGGVPTLTIPDNTKCAVSITRAGHCVGGWPIRSAQDSWADMGADSRRA